MTVEDEADELHALAQRLHALRTMPRPILDKRPFTRSYLQGTLDRLGDVERELLAMADRLMGFADAEQDGAANRMVGATQTGLGTFTG